MYLNFEHPHYPLSLMPSFKSIVFIETSGQSLQLIPVFRNKKSERTTMSTKMLYYESRTASFNPYYAKAVGSSVCCDTDHSILIGFINEERRGPGHNSNSVPS